MADDEQKVCDGCHERPAVHHTCYGHTGETRGLCLECFEQLASPEELTDARHSEEIIRKGKCQYCGAPAVGGSIFSAIPGVNDEETHLWCEQCRLDLVEFAGRPENAIADDFDVEDEAKLEQSSQQLAERQRRETEFMRQRVSQRTPQ